jgi:hypothetical protein
VICSTENRFLFTASSWPAGPDYAAALALKVVRKTRSPSIRAIVELKSRNPRFGCPRIARIISHTFGVDIDKNVVYRV